MLSVREGSRSKRLVKRAYRQDGGAVGRLSDRVYPARAGAVVASRGDDQRSTLEAHPRYLFVRGVEPPLVQPYCSSERHADDLASVGDRPLHARYDPGSSTTTLVAQHLPGENVAVGGAAVARGAAPPRLEGNPGAARGTDAV